MDASAFGPTLGQTWIREEEESEGKWRPQAYCDEPSVEAFLTKVARGVYPHTTRVKGSLPKWPANPHCLQRLPLG
jgi:hypothetical protein